MVRRPIVAGLGEVLWDQFPDGPRFGGAPANFACSLAGLCSDGMDVSMVSGVGRDDLGRRATDFLQTRGVDTSGVASLDRPTGQVFVELDAAGEASFEIASDTAWDNIPWSDVLQQLAASAHAVCFGTLGQRSPTSRQTIQRFVEATRPECHRILDVNLRPPFWNRDIVERSLELANVVKLNDTELSVLAKTFGWPGGSEQQIEHLMDRYSLQAVALTRGERGALLTSGSYDDSELPGEPISVVDTVGAGDAYTAVLALGLIKGLSIGTVNEWAIRVASYVCSQAGAAPLIPDKLRSPGGDK